jgi:hypothetical protein
MKRTVAERKKVKVRVQWMYGKKGTARCAPNDLTGEFHLWFKPAAKGVAKNTPHADDMEISSIILANIELRGKSLPNEVKEQLAGLNLGFQYNALSHVLKYVPPVEERKV